MAERETPQQRSIDRQYPLALAVRYRAYRGTTLVEAGVGETILIGVRNVLFRAKQSLDSGLLIDLSIDWPALLDDRTPLQFCVFGRIVLTSGARVLVHTLCHDLKLRPALAKGAGR